MPKGNMIWNADADARLFAAVLSTSDVKVDYSAVATVMGPQCTAKAITHRIAAIRKKAAEAPKDAGDGTATAAPSATPGKRASPVKAEKATPAKKAKTTAAKKKTTAPNGDKAEVIKAEVKDEEEGQESGEDEEEDD